MGLNRTNKWKHILVVISNVSHNYLSSFKYFFFFSSFCAFYDMMDQYDVQYACTMFSNLMIELWQLMTRYIFTTNMQT